MISLDGVNVVLIIFRFTDKEVVEWKKNLEKVEKGEAKILRNIEIRGILKAKVESYKKPFEQLQLDYGGKNSKNFTVAEDRYLVCMMQQLGYRPTPHTREHIPYMVNNIC